MKNKFTKSIHSFYCLQKYWHFNAFEKSLDKIFFPSKKSFTRLPEFLKKFIKILVYINKFLDE